MWTSLPHWHTLRPVLTVRVLPLEALRGGRPLVELAPGVRIPSRFRGDVEGADLPYDVALEVVFEDGRFVCEALQCQRKTGGPPVKTELIRKLPVAQLVRLVAGGHLFQVQESSPGKCAVEPLNLPEPRAGEGPTEDVLRDVALTYRFAFAAGEPPTKTVMHHFEISRATAGRWVSMARELGYLGITEERKAGVN